MTGPRDARLSGCLAVSSDARPEDARPATGATPSMMTLRDRRTPTSPAVKISNRASRLVARIAPSVAYGLGL
jgi:hypothetical protein